jgi:hypothetical protein
MKRETYEVVHEEYSCGLQCIQKVGFRSTRTTTSGRTSDVKLGGQEPLDKRLLATKLFGLFGFVKESSDLYFSALVVFVHGRREPKSNVVNDTLQVGTLMHT